jgi:hypothetical protein
LEALALAGKEEAEGVFQGASAMSALSRSITERSADPDLLDVRLKSGEAGALP